VIFAARRTLRRVTKPKLNLKWRSQNVRSKRDGEPNKESIR
jgi:hypothetical protein